MYPLILCFCGRSLGDIYAAFNYLRLIEIQKNEDLRGVIPELIPLIETENMNLAPIFDSLMIFTKCCKKTLMSQCLIEELY